MKNNENLRQELLAKIDGANRAMEKIEKADFLLKNWVDDYGYIEKPCYNAAMDYWNGSDESRHAKQSATWLWDYDLIFIYVDMAKDYVFETKNILKEILEIKESLKVATEQN